MTVLSTIDPAGTDVTRMACLPDAAKPLTFARGNSFLRRAPSRPPLGPEESGMRARLTWQARSPGFIHPLPVGEPTKILPATKPVK